MKFQPDRKKARRRALRAAQVVTIGLALVGCGESHESMGDAGGDTSMMDAIVADAGSDTSIACDAVFPPNTRECCEAEAGGYWDEASSECWVAVPGPFVPPAMRA